MLSEEHGCMRSYMTIRRECCISFDTNIVFNKRYQSQAYVMDKCSYRSILAYNGSGPKR